MSDGKLKKCKKKRCNNPVLEGKYCLRCKQIRKERRDKLIKGFGRTALGIGSIAVTALLNRKPK